MSRRTSISGASSGFGTPNVASGSGPNPYSAQHSSLDSRSSLSSRGSDRTSMLEARGEYDLITLDCTNRASVMLMDSMKMVNTKLCHLRMEVTDVDKMKGKASVSFDNISGDIFIDSKFSFRMKFKAWNEHKKEFNGFLYIENLTRDKIVNELEPFPMTVTWLHDVSPTGVEYNQVVAVVKSAKTYISIREQYASYEEKVMTDYIPRFQTQRAGGVYLNLIDKKGAVFDLSLIASAVEKVGSNRYGIVTDDTNHERLSTADSQNEQKIGSIRSRAGTPTTPQWEPKTGRKSKDSKRSSTPTSRSGSAEMVKVKNPWKKETIPL
jgi:hypothetical protein